MRHSRLIFSAFAFILGASFARASLIGVSRIWHSDDQRQIHAKALEIDSKKKTIRLERSDGMRFTIDWSRLSEADQTILAKTSEEAKPSAQSIKINETSETLELPDKLIHKDVPMVVQKGNFCVPASATMIAAFHGIDTDQDQVAALSSEMSASNQGTYPRDMLLAMEKLGFTGRTLNWEDEDDFNKKSALNRIQYSLLNDGPVYVSFRPGVFGVMGHGCVIVGYHQRKKELYFHNPWGNTFTQKYEAFERDGRGVVFIEPPQPAPIATEEFIGHIQSVLPVFDGDLLNVVRILEREAVDHELVWCSRRDSRDDKSFARNTARDDGRLILELSFERNPAVIIPYSKEGVTESYQFVTRPPEGGARFLVQKIDKNGWSEPELETLGNLTRNWVTLFDGAQSGEKIWELPMIELQPVPTL